jgi:hypothetical protein
MTEAFVRKCPFCSGDMLRSKMPGHIVFTPPWSGIFKGGKIRAYPWACMGCGVVLHYVESLPVLSAEYREQGAGAAAVSSAATPLKS